IAVADLDRDGKLDLAVGSKTSNEVFVLRGSGDGTFKPPVSYKVVGAPSSIATGDFNADGKPDLAVTSSTFNYSTKHSVSVLLGNGDGTFQMPVNYETGSNPWAVVVGDFDGDGFLDLGVANKDGPNVSILFGNNDGTFQAALNSSAGPRPLALASGDLNGDGMPDVVVSNLNSGTVSVLLAKGRGVFYEPKTFAAGPDPTEIALGDFNQDGKLDLAIANRRPSSLGILFGNGDGTFQPATFLSVALSTYTDLVLTADFNGDGISDLAISGVHARQVAVMLGRGDGGFLPALYSSISSGLNSWVSGDLNRDGKGDLVLVQDNGTVSILLGKNDGTFQTGGVNPVGSDPRRAVVADFNGDGRADLAVASFGSRDVSILLGNGDGSFQTGVRYAMSDYLWLLTAADIDGDGKMDLLASSGNYHHILWGNGDGTFQVPVSFSTASLPNAISMPDFNGDGAADLLFANPSTDDVSVYLNRTRRRCCSEVTVAPLLLPDAVTGWPYRQGLTASGGSAPYLFSLTSGLLPAGLSLASYGEVGGTPAETGVFPFGVTVSDAHQCS
ncbi:MAG TPA: FG-GAP-like repeat-containing protein, partial [Nitrospirota bacterium]